MRAEEYLAGNRLFRRLKSGPHGQLVELYAARLVKDGLARQSIWRSLNLIGGLLSWIAKSRVKVTDLDEGMVERYLRHQAGKQSIQPGDRAALKRGCYPCCAMRARSRQRHCRRSARRTRYPSRQLP